jgi:hypothetical protein
VVAGTPIPRSFFEKGLMIKVAAYRRAFGASSLDAAALRRLRDETLTGLVRDIVVVLEARRLHLAPTKAGALNVITEHSGLIPILYERLYSFAARGVPPPRNARIRAALAQGIDPDYIGSVLTRREVLLYNRWMAARDRVATAWFKRLFRRYARRTEYAAGFRPSARVGG